MALNDFDLGQAIDGLEARAKAWANTAHYLQTGESPEEFFIAEGCDGADEAIQLAKHYRSIMSGAGWMHVLVMTFLLTVMLVYAVSPLPREVVIAVSFLLTTHIFLAWYSQVGIRPENYGR